MISAITDARFPVSRIFEDEKRKFDWDARTSILALVETQQQADEPSNDQDQPNKVEVRYMFAESPSLVRVEVKEPKQNDSSNTASRSTTFAFS